ncbi:MAG: methyltransferase domain-containing protein [Actinomycetota bacterium]|nr:methyltransferase domain-containing protein [Actinomycetota bacterium]
MTSTPGIPSVPSDASSRSYDPRAMSGGLPGELERLEAQAQIAWGEEARLLAEVGLRDGDRVLEIGCGSGAVLSRLHALVPCSGLIGIDADEDLLAHARRRPELAGAELLAADAYALPLADGSVDFALARLVLQHLADPVAALLEIVRVLRPGGAVAVLEVDGELWGVVEPRLPDLAAIQAKAWRSQASRGGDRFIARRLWRLLGQAGLVEVVVRPYAYHSDELGLEAFEPMLSPDTLAPRLADGTISPTEFATAVRGLRRFRETPGAFVMLVGLLVAGRAP